MSPLFQPLLKRRTLLKTALLTPLLGLAKPARANALRDVSVVVIGAGIAGLAAARALKDLGAEVVVLEAKGQVGGRLKTDWSLGAPFELGAGWIHGPQDNPISELARQVGAQTYVTDDDSLAVYRQDGSRVPDADLVRLDSDYERLLEAVDDEVEVSDGLSLAQAIRRVDSGALNDPLMRWALTAFTEFDTGGPLEALSAYHFDEDEAYDGADVILPGGYDKILAPLAEGLDIRLNSPVTAIAYDEDDGVTVTSKAGEIEADYAVCALPLGVLKAGRVRFEPALPRSHRRGIETIPMGNVTKAALSFAKPFWPLDVQYFGYQSDEMGRWPYVMNYRTFAEQNILVALSFGSYAGQVERRDDTAITTEIMSTLRSMFGSAAPDPQQILVTRWSQDPYSLGAYSYTGVGVLPDHYDDLADPLEDCLIFAGEHTIFDYHATTHGALLSGRAAAEAILELED